jgi:hypothetical protein
VELTSICPANKVSFLNEINQEFFSVGKMPLAFLFTAIAGTATYPTSSGVRSKNIDLVNVGITRDISFQNDDLLPRSKY